MANGGTLFLDEIGDMPASIQAKILRLLQEKSIERLGGRETIPVNVRIIAATNRNLESALSEGRFREDLYYRLKVVTIWLPPLHERPPDIPLLTAYFLSRYAGEKKMDNPGITKEAMKILKNHPWPGNVRELRNLLESTVLFAPADEITLEDLPSEYRTSSQVAASAEPAEWRPRPMAEIEREAILRTVDHTGGHRAKAAELLGITRPTLYDLLNKYGLSADSYSKKAAP